MERREIAQLDAQTARIFTAADAYIDFIVTTEQDFPIKIAGKTYFSRDGAGITRVIYVVIYNFVCKIIRHRGGFTDADTYILFLLTQKAGDSYPKDVELTNSTHLDKFRRSFTKTIFSRKPSRDFRDICELLQAGRQLLAHISTGNTKREGDVINEFAIYS